MTPQTQRRDAIAGLIGVSLMLATVLAFIVQSAFGGEPQALSQPVDTQRGSDDRPAVRLAADSSPPEVLASATNETTPMFEHRGLTTFPFKERNMAATQTTTRGRGFKDRTGAKFGRLRVIRWSHKSDMGKHYWECQCECGALTVVRGTHLGKSIVSCGCLAREIAAKRMRRDRPARTHGRTGTSEHAIWKTMHSRCQNPNSHNYSDYGARGIAVCERWNSFENFFADMGPRPSRLHSINRNDNDGPYCKENCDWATQHEQSRNTRNTIRITWNGKTKSLSEWCDDFKLDHKLVDNRLRTRWTIQAALTTNGTRPRHILHRET